MKKRLVAGCMTGTSLDGLDVALVEIEGTGLKMQTSIKQLISRPLGKLADRMRFITQRLPITAKEIAQISHELSMIHLDALKDITGDYKLDLVSIHGQTVYHVPPLSLQMINPTPVAVGLNVPVITDLRAADLASGGQGAPITPISDFVLYSSGSEIRCIVNLGGFCNLTELQKSSRKTAKQIESSVKQIRGQDVCACNQILDTVSRELFKTPLDMGGSRAFKGCVQKEAFDSLESHLKKQSESNRSLGTGDERFSAWLEKYSNEYPADDIARSACAAIASTIVSKCGSAKRIILAGGGIKNRALVAEIRDRSKTPVELSDDTGIPSTHREAIAMAILGALCQDRVPITLPQVTGADHQIISGIWALP